MGYSVIVPPTGGKNDTTPPASAYALGDKIKAAIAAGAFVAVGLTVAGWVILFLIDAVVWLPRPPWQAWLAAVGVAGVIGLLVTCWYGQAWAVNAAVRAWAVDDDERAYQRKLAEDARKEQEQAADRAKENIRSGPLDHDHNPATLTLEQELHLVAWEMLARACLGRGKPTREAMEEDGVCNQRQWNLVNGAMQAIGLKKGYSWETVTFEAAWDCWRANVRVEADEDGAVYVWALRPGGWKAVERVA